tara:strand:+ start:22748 stop:23173 length:426 start_codon:yes stop_codon:yes gene_type:complete
MTLSNCDSSKKTQQNNPNAEFTVLHKSEYGGKDGKCYDIIKNNNDRTQLLLSLNLDEETAQQLKGVDLNTHTILALHMGQHNTGGYSIDISNVEENGDTTYVTVEEKGPEPGAMVTMALTNPYCIALVEKNETIVFKANEK